MLKKVVFDFDGTVADTFQQTIDLIREVKPDLSDKIIKRYRELGAKKVKSELKISLREIFRVMRLIKDKQLDTIEKAVAFRGMKKLIEELREKKIEVGILSSNSKKNIEKWLQKELIMIDWVRSESTLFGKEKALIKVKSADMLYVGDEIRDIEACHKIGIKIVAVTWGYNSEKALRQANPDYLVGEVKELRNLFLTLCQ